VLDTHSPLVCLSIAPLYGLRYSPASCRLPPSDIQDKTPTVQVGHYGRPTVTLSEYNFEIHHIKGTSNGRADALSRRPDYNQGHEDNQNVTVLPQQVFVRAMEVLPDIPSQEESVLKPWIDPHQLKQHQGIWYKNERQVVTGGIKDKRNIIQSHHDTPVHGHPGISKTIQLTESVTVGRP
jgi:hypothetical protein